MSRLVGSSGRVTSVDIDPRIAGDARLALEAGGFAARVVVGDGRRGWPGDAPFDRIIVTASAGVVPVAWLEQLVEGGLLEFPLRVDPASTALQLIPVLCRAGGVLRTVAMSWGGFMPVHGGGGGWELLPPALSAGRSGGGGGGPWVAGRSTRSAGRWSGSMGRVWRVCPMPERERSWRRCCGAPAVRSSPVPPSSGPAAHRSESNTRCSGSPSAGVSG